MMERFVEVADEERRKEVRREEKESVWKRVVLIFAVGVETCVGGSDGVLREVEGDEGQARSEVEYVYISRR